MEGVHVLADHGAWLLYIAGFAYKLHVNIQWLFFSQAAALSFTAIPIWAVGRQANLSRKQCWLVCGLWWLQPVVFNANLFDFHPEVWAMPALACSFWASRAGKPLVWFLLLVLMLGCRDGLVLVVFGLGIEHLIRKKWVWAFAAIGFALSWLALLNKWLYPMLTGSNQGPKAVSTLFAYLGNNFEEVLWSLISKPWLLINGVDWFGGIIYLLLISISVIPFLSRHSLPTLCAGLPLIVVNLLSEEAPQRTLIHHYSLPLAVIAVVAVTDALAIVPRPSFPWRSLAWSAVCWAALAKPWFFTGPYLERVDSIPSFREAIISINQNSRLLTTSYLVPHLSQRLEVSFPTGNEPEASLNRFDALLLKPEDPGWGSTQQIQQRLLDKARKANWTCTNWANGLSLCKKPNLSN